MKKWNIYRLVVILILLIKHDASAQTVRLIKTTFLPSYPSASAIEFYKDELYVIGDDARHLLILDKELNIRDSVLLFKGAENRIAKDKKADLEAAALTNENGRTTLYAFSSFSTAKRIKQLILYPETKKYKIESVRSYLKGLKQTGLKELNIEGAAFV